MPTALSIHSLAFPSLPLLLLPIPRPQTFLLRDAPSTVNRDTAVPKTCDFYPTRDDVVSKRFSLNRETRVEKVIERCVPCRVSKDGARPKLGGFGQLREERDERIEGWSGRRGRRSFVNRVVEGQSVRDLGKKTRSNLVETLSPRREGEGYNLSLLNVRRSPGRFKRSSPPICSPMLLRLNR